MNLRAILTRTSFMFCTVIPATVALPLSLLGAFSQPVDSFELNAPVPSGVSIELPQLERSAHTASSLPRETMAIAQLRLDRDKDKDDDQPMRIPGANSSAGFKHGSPDEAIYNFCQALADDNTATASDYVSPGAKGLLGQMRDGELGEDKIEELVNFMTPFSDLEPVKRGQTMTKRILDNKKGQVMTFLLKKDKDQEFYRITEISITKSKR